MKSKEKIVIELYEEYEEVNFYTLKYVSKEESETDDFFIRFYDDDSCEEDIEIISRMIEKIGENGAEIRHFREEGKMSDQVGALPERIYSVNLRLYAIRLSRNIVILGNGGLKTTRTYNEDPYLDNCVEVLRKINHLLNYRIRNGKVFVYNKLLTGQLTFYI